MDINFKILQSKYFIYLFNILISIFSIIKTKGVLVTQLFNSIDHGIKFVNRCMLVTVCIILLCSSKCSSICLFSILPAAILYNLL